MCIQDELHWMNASLGSLLALTGPVFTMFLTEKEEESDTFEVKFQRTFGGEKPLRPLFLQLKSAIFLL